MIRFFIIILLTFANIGHAETLRLAVTTSFHNSCLLYTSPSPRDRQKSRMPSSA